MKKLILMTCAALMTAVASGQEAVKTAGIEYKYMDTSARPGDDFAKYATGHWAEFNPQPKEYPMWGTVTKVSDDNMKALAAMIQDIAATQNERGTVARKIGDLYNLVMDSARLNREGAAPLRKRLAELDGITTREQLLHYQAVNHANPLFSLGISADLKDADNNIVCISQSGLSLDNRDYYLANDGKSIEVRKAMKQHIKNLFVLTGYAEDVAEAKMQRVWALESELAVPYYAKERLRVPEANYHKICVDSLQRLCGTFNWKKYLCDYHYDQTTVVDLGQPEPVAKACEMLMTASLEDLKTLMQWKIISAGAGFLSDDFADENLSFRRVLLGSAQKFPRWKMAESVVDGIMADAVGQMYVERYFSQEAKTEMLELIHNLQAALAARIKAQTWMCDETKAFALDKLANYKIKVGFPDEWDDLTDLVIDPTKSLYENMREANKFYWDLNYRKKYNKPVDKREWHMPAQTVNAYYNPTTNEICFPAGFLQPPLFNLKSDAAANYGAIGVVIGHEMTHGFDDQGRQFNKDGNLCNWWTDADGRQFKALCGQMEEYFNGLWVIPNELKTNGTLCLGENIADQGGLNIAYDAFQMWQNQHGQLPDDNGFSPEQRFFLSYANVWAGSASKEILHYLTKMDPHSPNHLRINGALSQCDYWYDAFHIRPGDALYIEPENRVKVW